MGPRAVPAPFLTKTYELVEDRSTEEVIGWSEGGTTFVVWQTADFAKDLLPKYFKHNNFSSFVRQLNTYGFRKIVPDKWEFANDNFKRGQKDLLTLIRRRKAVPILATGKSNAASGPSSPSNSGDDLGSTSTYSKNAGSVDAPPARAQFADLSDENKKLKRENESLSSELARAKKQCDELINFLTEVAPDQIDRITRQGSRGPTRDGSDGADQDECIDADDDETRGEKNAEGLKLFGVWVKGNAKKRARDEKLGLEGLSERNEKVLNLTSN